MVDFYIIIVLYNKKLYESSAYRTLKKAGTTDNCNKCFMIVDNSTVDEIKKVNVIESKNDVYIDMYGNKGLSVAYNKAIQQIQKDFNSWIVTSDQDTSYPNNYFFELENSINRFKNELIFVPKVYNSKKIMSPFKLFFDLKNESIRIINSGSVFNSIVFERIKYNENLFLDFVDYDLVNSLIINKINICVTKIHLYQDFSGTDFENKISAIKRFEIYLNDAKKYYDEWKVGTISKYFYVIKRMFSLTIRFKSIEFLKLFFNVYF